MMIRAQPQTLWSAGHKNQEGVWIKYYEKKLKQRKVPEHQILKSTEQERMNPKKQTTQIYRNWILEPQNEQQLTFILKDKCSSISISD